MKKFIYLIQGQENLVNKYLELTNRADADVMFLTYDKPVEGMIFFPNSTWAEGRNKLLAQALIKGKYDYYIFCDDDIKFEKGGWNEFEAGLISLNPLIAVPIVPRLMHKRRNIKSLKYQLFALNDEQLMAFHHSVIIDNIALPYQTQFDYIHWWAPSEIQEILIQNFYYHSAVQFNNIYILNNEHHRYPNSRKNPSTFQKPIHSWLKNQFKSKYKKIHRPSKIDKVVSLYRTYKFLLNQRFFKTSLNTQLNEKTVRKLLKTDSVLLRQYLDNKHKS